ncbi:MAG: leucine-rich repeat domain-containing protein [Wolbachia sp.]
MSFNNEDAKELAKLTHLTSLDLRWNRIDDKSVEGYILISLKKKT